MDIAPQDADGSDRPLADQERYREHRAEAACPREVRILVAGVCPEVGALHRPPLLYRAPRHPLAEAQPDRRDQLLWNVEARDHDQLVGRRIERRHAARVDSQDSPGLLQDHPDRSADVEAGGDGTAGLEERAGLAGAAHALVEEPRAVDGDARLFGEGLEHALVVCREAARPRRECGDDPDDCADDLEGHAQHRPDAFALVDLAPRRARIGPHVGDPDRDALRGHPADDPLADRDRQRPPLLALESVGGRLDDLRPLAVEEADPAPAGADQRRHREADPVEDRRHVEARRDELARRVERRELVGPASALVG